MGEDEEGGGDGLVTTSVHYLASQYLADSSLSADVSQFNTFTTLQSSVSAIKNPERIYDFNFVFCLL